MEMTTGQKVEVMQAHMGGVCIEFRVKNSSNWIELQSENPEWNWAMLDYRIKPKLPKQNKAQFFMNKCPHCKKNLLTGVTLTTTNGNVE